MAKASYKALLFVLCINLGVLLVEENIAPTQVITSINTTQALDGYNVSTWVDTWSYSESEGLYGDVQSGVLFLWNTGETIVAGLPNLMTSMGAPSPLVLAVQVIWGFTWIVFIVELISGRNIT